MKLQQFELMAIEEARLILKSNITSDSFVNINIRLLKLLVELASMNTQIKKIDEAKETPFPKIDIVVDGQRIVPDKWPSTYPSDKVLD